MNEEEELLKEYQRINNPQKPSEDDLIRPPTKKTRYRSGEGSQDFLNKSLQIGASLAPDPTSPAEMSEFFTDLKSGMNAAKMAPGGPMIKGVAGAAGFGASRIARTVVGEAIGDVLNTARRWVDGKGWVAQTAEGVNIPWNDRWWIPSENQIVKTHMMAQAADGGDKQLNLDLQNTTPKTVPNKATQRSKQLDLINESGDAWNKVPQTDLNINQYIQKLTTNKRYHAERMNPERVKKVVKSLGLPPETSKNYLIAVADHDKALTQLIGEYNAMLGVGPGHPKSMTRQHALALKRVNDSGLMLGNKGMFPRMNFEDTLDHRSLTGQTFNIIREGNIPANIKGIDFPEVLSRVLGKPLSLEESILYFADQDLFYFYKELEPLQRQALVDIMRTQKGTRRIEVGDNLRNMIDDYLTKNKDKFSETMSGNVGRGITQDEELSALIDRAAAKLNVDKSARQMNIDEIN